MIFQSMVRSALYFFMSNSLPQNSYKPSQDLWEAKGEPKWFSGQRNPLVQSNNKQTDIDPLTLLHQNITELFFSSPFSKTTSFWNYFF